MYFVFVLLFFVNNLHVQLDWCKRKNVNIVRIRKSDIINWNMADSIIVRESKDNEAEKIASNRDCVQINIEAFCFYCSASLLIIIWLLA